MASLLLRELFGWRFTGFLVPISIGLGATMVTLAPHFELAIFFFSVSGLWILITWLLSDYLRLTSRQIATNRISAWRGSSTGDASQYLHYFFVKYVVPGIILLCTWQALAWVNQEKQKYELSLSEGWLLPGAYPTPANACDRLPQNILNRKPLTILLGNQTAFATKFPSTVLAINKRPVLILDRNEAGEVAITTDIYDKNDRIVVEIKKNKFTISNDVFQHPRDDFNTLKVVVKEQKETVLHIRYLNPSTLQILGSFRLPGAPQLTVRADSIEFGGMPTGQSMNCSGDNAGSQFAFTG